MRQHSAGRPLRSAAEVNVAESAVAHVLAAGWHGMLWIGEPGSGKSTVLHRAAARHGGPVLEIPHWERSCAPPEGATVNLLWHALEAEPAPSTDPSRTARTLARILDSRAAETGELVVLADDIDRMDSHSRTAVLTALPLCRRNVVLLATAADGGALDTPTAPLKRQVIDPCSDTTALAVLCRDVGPTAPHVASRLRRAAAGNIGGIVELAGGLTADQLRGLRALPDPMPATSVDRDIYGQLLAGLPPADRQLLLTAAVEVQGRTGVVLRACEREVSDLIDGPLAEFFTVVSGRYRLTDERLRALVHDDATPAQRSDAHTRLAEALAHEHPDLAIWHRSLSIVEADEAACRRLLLLAWRSMHRGECLWAQAVAREAASLASGDLVRRAQLVAGIAALLCGHVADAADWLRSVVQVPSAPVARQALVPWACAATLVAGSVPESEIVRLAAEIDRASPQEDARGAATAAGLTIAAALHAERRQQQAAAACLDRAAEHGGAQPGLRAVADSWCAAFGVGVPSPSPAQPDHAALQGFALLAHAAGELCHGDPQAAAVTLGEIPAAATTPLGQPHSDPWLTASPLLDAHTRVLRALTATVAGEHESARRELEEAAFAGPLILPFAGFGAVALSRNDVLVEGAPGTVATALCEISPETAQVRQEHLRDSALQAIMRGNRREAMAAITLAGRAGTARHPMSWLLPCLDPVTLLLMLGEDPAPGLLRLDDDASPIEQLHRDLLAGREDPADLLADNRELLDSLASLAQRGITEFALAMAFAEFGTPDPAREHQATAVAMLGESGAEALAELLSRRVEHALQRAEPSWRRHLTSREGQVATLAVRGDTNQDIASALHVSVRTVEVHLGRVFRKLRVHSRTELSYLAHQEPARSPAEPAGDRARIS